MDWSNIPSLSALRAFEAAARHQSLTRAAQELNVTHAAIAQHVRSLEAEFSESLLVRQGRGVAATAHGQQLAECLRGGFSTIAQGVDDLRRRGEDRPLNVTTTPAFAANWLMPRIGDFWAKHPEITLNISPGTGVTDLKKDGMDVAIRFGRGDWPHVSSEILTDGDYWVVAHPDLIGDRPITCLSDVTDLPWVLERHSVERRALIERENIDLDQVQITLLNTRELVQSAVTAGLGISVQSKALVERAVAAGELALICRLIEDGLGYYIVTLPDRDPKGLRVFIRWLKSQTGS